MSQNPPTPPRIVIIGASYAGLQASSIILTIPTEKVGSITLISPSPSAYYNVAAPRLLVKPDYFPATLVPVSDILTQNTKGKATFVMATVTGIDLDNKSILVTAADGSVSIVLYDIVILASGTTTSFPGFGVNLDINSTKAALTNVSTALKTAKTVALIGGGATGVECAGEIASMSQSPQVTLYTGMTAPLIDMGMSSRATKQLLKLKVNIVNNVKVLGNPASGVVTLPDGTTAQFDVVINCFLGPPSTAYLPALILDSAQYVLTNGLQVKGYEGSAIAFGDIVSGSPRTLVDLKFGQTSVFKKTLTNLVTAWPLSKPPTLFPTYKPFKSFAIVPIGPNGGVGKVFFIPIPSFLVKLIKSNNYMLEFAQSSFQ